VLSICFGFLSQSLEVDIITTVSITANDIFGQFDVLGENEPCPICKSTERTVDDSRAEVSCAHCGLVFEESMIDHRPEWMNFGDGKNRSRVGSPLSYGRVDRGLSTQINRSDVAKNCDSNNIAQMHRPIKWQRRACFSKGRERNLALALNIIDFHSSNLGIPRDVREDASLIYRTLSKKGCIRGRSIDAMVSASIYAACRRNNIPRNLHEISKVSHISKKKILKYYKFLSKQLNIKLKPTLPKDYISRFASELGLSGEIQAKAIEIIEGAVRSGLSSGRNPSGVAASALYISSRLCGDRKTQSEIARISGVSEVTIRKTYIELSKSL